jgi:hypothetical protein
VLSEGCDEEERGLRRVASKTKRQKKKEARSKEREVFLEVSTFFEG